MLTSRKRLERGHLGRPADLQIIVWTAETDSPSSDGLQLLATWTAANTTRRTLDRWLARAGLAPARTLLACARVSAAFQLMSSGGVRTRGAAALLGYASPRALSRELQWLAGFGASAVPSHMTHAALVAALRPRLFRNATVAEPSY